MNASLGDKAYEDKLPHYLKANALAQSLHPSFYQNNPGVLNAIKTYKLAFKPHEKFGWKDIKRRSNLYCELAALIWSPDRLLGETV